MDILTASTGKDWVSTTGINHADEKTAQKTEGFNQRLNQLLTEILLSENLVMLAGLGTTLYVKDGSGKPVAPTMGKLWDESITIAGEGFGALKAHVKYATPPEGDNIELLLSHCQLAQRFDPSAEVAKFVESAEALIVKRCRFVNSESNLTFHESFLRKVARRNPRKPRLKLFTTNYDIAFETAASHARFIAVDGFSHTHPQEFDGSHFNYDFVLRSQDRDVPDYLANVFHLYKLHGSVDWELDRSQVMKRPSPTKPLIIYPRLSKFESSYDQPFIELMSRFQLSLREPNTGLLVLGFGLDDQHIVQPIMSAIRANVGLKAAIVDPALKGSKKEPVAAIQSLIQNGDWRLALVNAKFEDVVPLLPDLVKETEAEQHRARLRGLENAK
ncbi:MAG TPA: SIR2 family protein [Candidatus Dormibacteraeota bacterium]|nr:SIR2 family protein [Candidatus Dormibacteraeota bacterium]